MFRFTDLIRGDMIVRDVKVQHPETVPIFEQFGFRGACDDCDIDQVARKYGLQPLEIVAALNQVVFPARGEA